MTLKKFAPFVLSALAVFTFALPAHAALTSGQVDSIMGLLRAFGAGQSVILNVQAALTGSAPAAASCVTLSHDLTLGSTDAVTGGDVTRLQTFLQNEGDFTYTGTKGYYGYITATALGKYQVAHGLASSASDADYGLANAAVRAAVSCAAGTAVSSVSTAGSQLYTSNSYGFTVRYPNDWKIEPVPETASQWVQANIQGFDGTGYAPVFAVAKSGTLRTNDGSNRPVNDAGLYILASKDARDIAQCKAGDTSTDSVSDTTVGGVSGVVFHSATGASTGSDSYTITKAPDNGYCFYISERLSAVRSWSATTSDESAAAPEISALKSELSGIEKSIVFTR